jgi:hypothetical protein
MPKDKANRLQDLDHFLRTPLVTDASGDPFGLHRPGYRYLVDVLALVEIRDPSYFQSLSR